MADGQLNAFPDQGKSFAAASDVIVANVVHAITLFPLNWISLAENLGVGADNAVRRCCWRCASCSNFNGNDLKLDRAHVATHNKSVANLDRAVRLREIRLQPDLKQVAGNALDRVGKREDGHLGTVRDVVDFVNSNNVAEFDGQVLANAAVHPDLALVARVVGSADKNRLLFALAFHNDAVATENVQHTHRVLVHGENGVVIVGIVVQDQAVLGPLWLWGSGSHFAK